MIRMQTDPGSELDQAREIADVLLRGGLVGMRTDTVYGVLASVNRPDALKRLGQLKRRKPGHPFLLLAGDWISVRSVSSHLSPVARRLGASYWPGPMTLVLPAEPSLPDQVKGSGPTVAVRIPHGELLNATLRFMRCALAAPSANLPNESPAANAEAVVEVFPELDLVVDGGCVEEGVSSTIVNCTGSSAELLRRGSVVPGPAELS